METSLYYNFFLSLFADIAENNILLKERVNLKYKANPNLYYFVFFELMLHYVELFLAKITILFSQPL